MVAHFTISGKRYNGIYVTVLFYMHFYLGTKLAYKENKHRIDSKRA